MSFTGRFKLIVSYLKSKDVIKTQKELGYMLGFETESGFSQVVNSKTPFSETLEDKLRTLYPELNINWLVTGEGAMLKGEAVKSDVSHLVQNLPSTMQHITPQITEGIGVPYFDVDFVGGFDVVINDHTVKPGFYINYPPFNECTCWVNLIGDSMKGDSDKSILPNSIIALKYEADWKSFTLLNENYAIVTDDFRTVKMLGEGKDDEHFNMIPHNQYYSSQQIPKSMIRHLFRVKGSMKKFF